MSYLLTTFHRPILLTVSATFAATASLTYISLFTPKPRTMSTSSSPFQIRAYTPIHETFPYTTADLTPSDTTNDSSFYSSPRFVTHIDDHAIGLLRRYYGTVLPSPSPDMRPRVLDLCSSWISHYPSHLETAAKAGEDIGIEIVGTGMSAAELSANSLFGGKSGSKRWVVKDLNADPSVPPLATLFGDKEEKKLDVTTMSVSVDYLTEPVDVLSSLLQKTRVGGTVHLAVSNRCFPTKAVARWLRIDEEERLQMVGDYLWFSGWRNVEIVTLSDGHLEEEEGGGKAEESQLRSLMSMMGLSGSGCDPLWVVRGRKVDGAGKGKI